MVEGPANSVMFANNNPGTVRAELFESFVSFEQYDHAHGHLLGGFTLKRSGACISIYRNQIVEGFLNTTNLAWLWFVDSDIILEDDTLEKLMEVADHDKAPVVGGNYFMAVGPGRIVPSMYYRKKFPDGHVKMAPIWEVGQEYPANQLVSCDGLGAGCTLMSRKLLEAMRERYPNPEPWFSQQNIDGVVHGEDLSFCHRVKEMGYPLYVHTGIEVGHVKSMVLDSKSLHLGVR